MPNGPQNGQAPAEAANAGGEVVFGGVSREGPSGLDPIVTGNGGSSPSSAARDFTPCPVIPDHELIRRIGRGSYGEVWLARNVMGEYRAVKIVYRESFDSDRPYEREFNGIRQFEPVSRSHPSQVNILHVGRAPGCFFYVMELADDANERDAQAASDGTETQTPKSGNSTRGLQADTYCPKTLKEVLLHHPRLPAADCVEIALALTTALEHLHERGLVHRDVKPSNVVFIHGIPKLADIGLVTSIDVSHSFVGTEGFVPPEGPGTPSADIYGLGKLLYEISSGKDRRDFPEPPTMLGDLQDREMLLELDEIIQKACASPVTERYDSAAQMHQDLLMLKAGKSLRRTRQLERRLALMTRAGVAVLVVMFLGVVPYFLALREAARARHAEMDAKEKLRISYLAEARALRNSGRAGQRFESLRAIRNAAAIRADVEARSEAINSLALTDLRLVPEAFVHLEMVGPEGCFDFQLKRVAVLDGQGSVAIYPVGGGLPTRLTLTGMQPTALTGFNPDGRFLAVGYAGQTNAVWDIARQKIVLSLGVGNAGQAFSSDSQLLAVNGEEAIKLYSLSSFSEIRRLPVVAKFDLLTFSPDSASLACARFGHSDVRIIDAASGHTNSSLLCPATVDCLAWDPSGLLLAVGCEDNLVYVWNVKEGRQLAVLEGHTGRLSGLAFHPKEEILASSGEDDSIRLWNLRSHQQITVHNGGGWPLQFSPEGGRLGGFKGATNAGILEVALSREYRRMIVPYNHPGVAGPEFSVDGRFVVAGTGERIRFWDVILGKEVISLLPVGECDTVLFHPDGRRMVSAERYGGVFSRGFARVSNSVGPEYRLGRPECLYEGFDLRDAAISLDGRKLAVVDHDKGALTVLDLERGDRRVLDGWHPQADYVALSPTGEWAATGSWKKGKVFIWNTISAKQVHCLDMAPRTRVVFSPDGQWLGTSSSDYRLWRVGTWEPDGKALPGHSNPDFNFMAFSPDARLMALVDAGRRIQLVETSTRKVNANLEGPDGTPIFALRFSPDGSHLAAMEWAQKLQLWDLRMIRGELKEMGLDWEGPPYPKAGSESGVAMLHVDSGPHTLAEVVRSIPSRDPSTPSNLIDLSPYYNLSLTASWHYGDGPSGLAQLPRGTRTNDGVPFDVRGLVRVGPIQSTGEPYPGKVEGIRVGRHCASLHLLFGATPLPEHPESLQIGSCRIHYANGETVEFPLILGTSPETRLSTPQVNDQPPAVAVAWTGVPTEGTRDERIHVFKTSWKNSRLNELVQSIDLVAGPSDLGTFLVALTAE